MKFCLGPKCHLENRNYKLTKHYKLFIRDTKLYALHIGLENVTHC